MENIFFKFKCMVETKGEADWEAFSNLLKISILPSDF